MDKQHRVSASRERHNYQTRKKKSNTQPRERGGKKQFVKITSLRKDLLLHRDARELIAHQGTVMEEEPLGKTCGSDIAHIV